MAICLCRRPSISSCLRCLVSCTDSSCPWPAAPERRAPSGSSLCQLITCEDEDDGGALAAAYLLRLQMYSVTLSWPFALRRLGSWLYRRTVLKCLLRLCSSSSGTYGGPQHQQEQYLPYPTLPYPHVESVTCGESNLLKGTECRYAKLLRYAFTMSGHCTKSSR